jgi:hypothetical protein
MSDKRRILFEPTPRQAEFLACPAREVLYGGAAGGGKSTALLASAVSQTANGAHRALILRRSYPMLKDLIAQSHEFYRGLGATYNKTDHQWTFPSGAIVEFGHLDSDEDKYNYQGRAFSFIGWDELTNWPGDGVDAQGEPCNSSYVYLLSRLRAVEDSGLRLEVRATTCPGGSGHSWVKSRWAIPNDGSGSERIDPQSGFRRVFIPARLSDNPYLAGTGYQRTLEALPEATRKALLLGRFDVFEGAVFSEWDYNRHTCDEFAIPGTWEVWRGADDGYNAPAACLWLTRDETHDRIFVIAELYRSGMTPEVFAQAVFKIDRHIPIDLGDGEIIDNDMPLDGVIDSSAFAEIGLGNENGKGSRGHIMNSLGCRWSPSVKGSGSRVQGVSAVHQRLALKADGYGGLVIFRNCRNLIRTLPAMTYDKTHPEDIDPACEEHAVKALMYGLTRRKLWGGMVKVKGL